MLRYLQARDAFRRRCGDAAGVVVDLQQPVRTSNPRMEKDPSLPKFAAKLKGLKKALTIARKEWRRTEVDRPQAGAWRVVSANPTWEKQSLSYLTERAFVHNAVHKRLCQKSGKDGKRVYRTDQRREKLLSYQREFYKTSADPDVDPKERKVKSVQQLDANRDLVSSWIGSVDDLTDGRVDELLSRCVGKPLTKVKKLNEILPKGSKLDQKKVGILELVLKNERAVRQKRAKRLGVYDPLRASSGPSRP